MSQAESERVGANPWAWAGAGFVLLACAFMYFQSEALAGLLGPASENPTPEDVERSIQRTFLGISLLLAAQSAVFFYLGIRQFQVARRAAEEGRFPPQGVRLLLPMRVVRDQRCNHLVLYYRFLALCNLVVAFAALWAASRAVL
jgi:hypothetical protein